MTPSALFLAFLTMTLDTQIVHGVGVGSSKPLVISLTNLDGNPYGDHREDRARTVWCAFRCVTGDAGYDVFSGPQHIFTAHRVTAHTVALPLGVEVVVENIGLRLHPTVALRAWSSLIVRKIQVVTSRAGSCGALSLDRFVSMVVIESHAHRISITVDDEVFERPPRKMNVRF